MAEITGGLLTVHLYEDNERTEISVSREKVDKEFTEEAIQLLEVILKRLKNRK